MKRIQKAVVLLLFLFLPFLFYAQTIVVEAYEETTLKKIEYISVIAFKNGKQKALTTTIPYQEFVSYDSLLIRSFGYKNKWLADLELPQGIAKDKKVPFGVVLTPLKTDVNEVVISAGKFSERKKDVARQIEVIKQKDIEFLSPSTSADILQNSGSVLVQKSQGGGGSPIIRGFEANKVQIVIDGVRLNNAIYRGGHLQNVLRIDNNALERVEVIQGAGSVIYGSDALGGVMHFVTKKPKLNTNDSDKLLFTVGANTRYGTAANELTGSLNFNFGWKKVALFTNLSYSQFGDIRQGSVGLDKEREAWKKSYFNSTLNGRDTMLLNTSPLVQFNSGYTQLDFLQKALIKTNETLEHTINFQYSTTGNVPRYDRLNLTDSGRNAQNEVNRFIGESPVTNSYLYSEWFYGPEKRLMLAYSMALRKPTSYGVKSTPKIKDFGKITVAYQNIEESRHTRRFKSDKRINREERVNVFSLNADFQEQKNRNEFRYGGEIIFNNVTSKANEENIVTGEIQPTVTRYPNGGSNMFLGAVYATLNRELRKGFILNAGIRYNIVTLSAKFTDTAITKLPFTQANQSNTALNGNIGLIYTTPTGWRFSALVSSAFRAPNVDDLGKVFDSNPNDSIVIVPNPDIKPEFTYNGEISVGKLLGEKGIIEAVGWYTFYRQAIVLQRTALNGQERILYDGVESRVFSNQNVQNAFLYGASLNTRFQITKSWMFTGRLNYTYGRIVTDSVLTPLAHIPPVFGRLGVHWQKRLFQLEVFSLFNGAKKPDDYNINGEDNFYQSTINGTPAWYTINIRGRYLLSEHSLIQIGLENILDQNYRMFASGISAPGRNVTITFRAWL